MDHIQVTVPQSMNSYFQSATSDAQSGGQLRVRHVALVTLQEVFELLELGKLAQPGVFLPQTRGYLLQQCRGPVFVIKLLRRQIVRRLETISRLGGFLIEGEKRLASAPFDRPPFGPFIHQEMFERGKQEGAKPAP